MRLQWLPYRRMLAVVIVLTSGLATLSLLRLVNRDITGTRTSTHLQGLQHLLKQAEISNAERLGRVEKVCRKFNLGLYRDTSAPPAFKHPPTPQYQVFYFDP